MRVSKGHYEKGLEYFDDAERLYDTGRHESGATLFILAAIKFNDCLCQEHLGLIPRAMDHKQALKREVPQLAKFLGADYQNYAAHFAYLLGRKNDTEYGVTARPDKGDAEALRKHCERLKAIVDKHYRERS